jgi:hypothetical protein
MDQPKESGRTVAQPEIQPVSKKAYHRPEFRFERVFETRALSCGKVQTTQAQCAHNRKSS